MNHDIDERLDGLDGLDDGLRERLNHLGRSATAGSRPWPGVDRAIHRHRRTSALRTGAVAVAVVAVAGAAAAGVPRLLGDATPPAERDPAVTRSYVPAPPWQVPTAGFVPIYENVRVRLDASTCRRVASVNLRDPSQVATAGYTRDLAARGDLSVARPCNDEHDVTELALTLPSLRQFQPDVQGVPTPDECVRDFREQTFVVHASLDTGYVRYAPGRWTGNQCGILPADPATGKPAALVAFSATSSGDRFVDVTVSAWTGTDEVATAPAARPTITPGTPGQQVYRDVRLRLPGKPQACASGNEAYLDLHVPEVNRSLALSDAALTRPCPDPGAAALQLGDPPRGVVLQKADVSAAECAAALESGTKVDTFRPVKGTTLCIVSPADAEQNLPALLVALTVARVNARTGAFDLSATAWVATPG